MARMLTREQKAMRRRWVRALRSGKFKQSRLVLEDEDGNCCLGVLCRVIQPKGEMPDWMRRKQSAECLSAKARKMAGVTLAEHDKLTNVNDDGMDDFKAIANIIEETTRKAKTT